MTEEFIGKIQLTDNQKIATTILVLCEIVDKDKAIEVAKVLTGVLYEPFTAGGVMIEIELLKSEI